MEYDIASGVFDEIQILGVLKINEGDRMLTANRILIGRYGELRIGDKENPF